MDRIEAALITVAAAVVIPWLYMLFVMAPVDMYNQAQCLKQGYPSGKISFDWP